MSCCWSSPPASRPPTSPRSSPWRSSGEVSRPEALHGGHPLRLLGQGLLVWHAVEQKKGASRRSGTGWRRTSSTSATGSPWTTSTSSSGGAASRPPPPWWLHALHQAVLHVDDEGHLINVAKARGRGPPSPPWWTTWSRPPSTWAPSSSATATAWPTPRRWPTRWRRMGRGTSSSTIGPVIGAHSGPGTVALFFLGTKR